MRRIAAGCSSVLGLDTFKDGPASGGSAGTSGGSGGQAGSGGSTPSGGAAGSGGSPTGGAAGSGGAPTGGGGAPTGGGGAPTGGTGGTLPFNCSVGSGAAGQVLLGPGELGDAYGLVALPDDAHSTAHVLIGQNWSGTPPSSHFSHEIVGVVARINDLKAQTGIAIGTGLRVSVQSGFIGNNAVLYGIAESGHVQGVISQLDSSGSYSPPTNPGTVQDLFDPTSQCVGVGQFPTVDGFAGFPTPAAYALDSVHFVTSCYSADSTGARRSYLGAGVGTAYEIMEVPNADSSLIPSGYYFDEGNSASLIWQKDSTFRVGSSAPELAKPPLSLSKPAGCPGPLVVVGTMPRKGGVNAFFNCASGGMDHFYYAAMAEPFASGIPAATPTQLQSSLPAPLGMSRAAITPTRRLIAARTQIDGQGHYYARLLVGDPSGNIIWDGSVGMETSEIQEVATAPMDAMHFVVAWRTIGGPIKGSLVTCTQ